MRIIKLMLIVAFIVAVGSSAGFPQDRRVTQQPNNPTVQQQQVVERQKVIQDLIDEKKQEAVSQPEAKDLAKPATFESTVPVK